jgi:hypothetical protein
MASNLLDMPILISQLPHLQQVAGPQHAPADAQQMLFGQIVADQQRQDDHKVQTVEKEDGLDAMGRDSGGNKNPGHHAPGRQHRQPASMADDASGPQASNASPWSGNIINVKI